MKLLEQILTTYGELIEISLKLTQFIISYSSIHRLGILSILSVCCISTVPSITLSLSSNLSSI